MTQVGHGRGKFDPTSLVALSGASHGSLLVESAVDLMEAQWGERIDAATRRLAPASRVLFEKRAGGLPESERRPLFESAVEEELEETMENLDPTLPQSRRPGRDFADSTSERIRLQSYWLYLQDLKGGQGLTGRRRDLTFDLRVLMAWNTRLEARLGYMRSDWDIQPGRTTDEGLTDLHVGLVRPFVITADRTRGSALRLLPLLGINAPTGEAEEDAPFAFAASTGVWRPAVGAVLEWTWDTDHTISLKTLYTGALGRKHGRRPGDVLETAVGYSERFGLFSLYLDLTSQLRLPDRRRGGDRSVEVVETGLDLGLRPALSIHLLENLEAFVQGRFTLARTGSGAAGGDGLMAGIAITY